MENNAVGTVCGHYHEVISSRCCLLTHVLPFPRTPAPITLPQDDAAAASWYPVNALPSLAFDHKQIIREAFQKLLERPEVQQAGVYVYIFGCMCVFLQDLVAINYGIMGTASGSCACRST